MVNLQTDIQLLEGYARQLGSQSFKKILVALIGNWHNHTHKRNT